MLEGEHKAEVDRRVRGQKTSAAAILARKAQVYTTDCTVRRPSGCDRLIPKPSCINACAAQPKLSAPFLCHWLLPKSSYICFKISLRLFILD